MIATNFHSISLQGLLQAARRETRVLTGGSWREEEEGKEGGWEEGRGEEEDQEERAWRTGADKRFCSARSPRRFLD